MTEKQKVDAWMRPDGTFARWAVVDPVGAWAGSGKVPRAPGVYVIYFDDKPVYVGQSNDLSARIGRHNIMPGYARNIHTPWGAVPDSVKVIAKIRRTRRLGDWAMLEIRLIARLQPQFNKTYRRQRGAA